MRAGRLRNPSVIFQRNQGAKDAAGDTIDDWVRRVKRRASVLPLSGKELQSAGQTIGEVSHKFSIRYDSETKNITHKDRILYDNRVFGIVSIINVGERGRELKILATERIGETYTAIAPTFVSKNTLANANPDYTDYVMTYDYDFVEGPTSPVGWVASVGGGSGIPISAAIVEGSIHLTVDRDGLSATPYEIAYDGSSGVFTCETEYEISNIQEA